MNAPYASCLFLLVAATAFGGIPANTIADLQPDLKQALLRDDDCIRRNIGNSNPSSGLDSPVLTEELLAAGQEDGVIATPQDDCHCRGRNCWTYVYLKTDNQYRLAFAGSFASLKPMKVVKHGLPSLSAKVEKNLWQEETTVFDWNGKQYQPSLCATVEKRPNRRLPRITQHVCAPSKSRESAD